jgi:KUP system potassium uptake protein
MCGVTTDDVPQSAALAHPTSAPGDTAGHRPGPVAPLMLAALGVVFGDIGASPLYSLQTVFSIDHNAVDATPDDVYGVISLVFWSVTTIVSVKYVSLVMRADNGGEGGILALTALLRGSFRRPGRRTSSRCSASSAPRCSTAIRSSPRRSR